MTLIEKHKVRWSTAALMWFLFFAFTFLVKFFDVKAIGPSGSMVGFSSLNKVFADAFPYNHFFHELSDLLGYAAILLDAAFALVALLQWINRKKLFKVEKNLLYLMFFYTLVLAIYVAFTFIVVNYRPVILEDEGGLESSYPSSHTVLAIASCYTGVLNLPALISKEKSRKYLSVALTVLGLLIIICRIASGVHWLSDIIGSLILVSALVMLYLASLTSNGVTKKYQGKRVSK